MMVVLLLNHHPIDHLQLKTLAFMRIVEKESPAGFPTGLLGSRTVKPSSDRA
jgi:hypothetical protein